MPPIPPQVPFGAVYFRKSNPPREDWARDYAVAAEDGLNTFRHWFMWSAIERAPGRYDWDDCDRQLDLAAENGALPEHGWFIGFTINSDGKPVSAVCVVLENTGNGGSAEAARIGGLIMRAAIGRGGS